MIDLASAQVAPLQIVLQDVPADTGVTLIGVDTGDDRGYAIKVMFDDELAARITPGGCLHAFGPLLGSIARR